MHTELYCDSLESLDRVAAIRAIHEAFMQLAAAQDGLECLDHGPALESLAACMRTAGHVAFCESELNGSV